LDGLKCPAAGEARSPDPASGSCGPPGLGTGPTPEVRGRGVVCSGNLGRSPMSLLSRGAYW
jgi:hypothetical protein